MSAAGRAATRTTWTNWARNQTCTPAAVRRPVTEAELVQLVKQAAANGQRVKAVGAGHSFTSIACTDGVLVDLGGYGRVLRHDAAFDQVTVEAGIPLHRLSDELDARGLALENMGDIDRQSISGATQTATHGTGLRFRNLSAQIVGMRLVTADGSVLECSASENADVFDAARVGLGAVGLVSTVTLQCVTAFRLHAVEEPAPVDDVLRDLDDLVEGNDHFEFWVFPYTRTALTRTCRRGGEQPSPPPWRRRLQEDAVENGLLDLVCRPGRGPTRRAAAEQAEALERRRLPVGFPPEVRFAAADDALLSTAHGRVSCYVAVHQYRGMEFESCFRAVEEIMDSYGGRPHWASATTRPPRRSPHAIPDGTGSRRCARGSTRAARSRTPTCAAASAEPEASPAGRSPGGPAGRRTP